MSTNSKKKIVIIGDSNTEGYGLLREESYPSLLSDTFSEKTIIYNKGVSGTSVITVKFNNKWVGMPYRTQMAYREALNLRGDLYIINLGTNDATDGEMDHHEGVDPYGNLMAFKDGFKRDYERILDDILEIRSDAVIMVVLPVPIRNSIWIKHKQMYLEELYAFILELAIDRSITCIPLSEAFKILEDADDYYLEDGLHLNPQGASLVASIMQPYITAFLKGEGA